MKKNVVAVLLAISLIIPCISIHVNAYEKGEGSDLKSEDFFIDEKVAYLMTEMFIDDMVASKTTNWNEETKIVGVRTLYSESKDEEITAYSFELDSGYVIVSAYLDVPSIFPEWSDKASPIYSNFDVNRGERIAYAGALSYFLDDGTANLKTIDGNYVNRKDITNYAKDSRNRIYVPENTVKYISELKRSQRNFNPNENCIEDIYAHAQQYYGAPYYYVGEMNYWESGNNSIEYHRGLEIQGNYYSYCGPLAITNMIINFGNRFNVNSITSSNFQDIFEQVAYIGTSNLYYLNTNFLGMGGTSSISANNFILKSFKHYGIDSPPIIVSGRYEMTYNNVKFSIDHDRLLYCMYRNHSYYGNHAVICFAYIRLYNMSGNAYQTYLKLIDGWSNSPRYSDIYGLSSLWQLWQLKEIIK